MYCRVSIRLIFDRDHRTECGFTRVAAARRGDRPPLCDEPEFAAIVDGMVAQEAPPLFALVAERDVRADVKIVGWGMSFDNRVAVFNTVSGQQLDFTSVRRAHDAFAPARPGPVGLAPPVTLLSGRPAR